MKIQCPLCGREYVDVVISIGWFDTTLTDIKQAILTGKPCCPFCVGGSEAEIDIFVREPRMIIPISIEGDNIRIKATESSHIALTLKWVISSWSTMTSRTHKFLIRSFALLNPHPILEYNDWCMVISNLFSGKLPYTVEGEDVLFKESLQ